MEATTDVLATLLDFSQLTSTSAVHTRFSDIAHELLHNYHLEIHAPNKAVEHLEILELEFYLFASGCHEDPFTHASHEQSQAGQWYFHRPPSRSKPDNQAPSTATATATAARAGYRGGTRKGLDLTIGHPPPGLGTSPRAVPSKYFAPRVQDLADSSVLAPAASTEPSAGTPQGSVLRGGVLLRSARRTRDACVISGPSLLVDEILHLSDAPSIASLVADHWDNNISAFPPSRSGSGPDGKDTIHPTPSEDGGGTSEPSHRRTSTMHLVRVHASARAPRVFRSPRIGLDIAHAAVRAAGVRAHAHPRVAFVARPYRFFVVPHLLTANGRGQTFVGVHDALVGARTGSGRGERDGVLVAEIAKLTGWKETTVGKYLGELREGLEGRGGGVEEWMGLKGKMVTSSAGAFLRMVGALSRAGVMDSEAAGKLVS